MRKEIILQLLHQLSVDISNQVQQEVQDQIIMRDIIIQQELGLRLLPELLIQLDLQDILIQPELGLPLVHLLM